MGDQKLVVQQHTDANDDGLNASCREAEVLRSATPAQGPRLASLPMTPGHAGLNSPDTTTPLRSSRTADNTPTRLKKLVQG